MTGHQPTILLVGLGHLGGVLLEYLAREEWIGRIVACTRRRESGEARCNLARLGAAAQGLLPQIDYRSTDIADADRFAETLNSVSPDLLLSTASLQTWWLPELLPEPHRSRLMAARFGIWLPLHLAASRDLMLGVRASGYRGPVLTAPFPDVVNCILDKVELAPTCGVGNVDELAAKVQLAAALHLDAPLDEVGVFLVAHHALEPAALAGDRELAPPFHLRVLHRGRDVTATIDAPSMLFAPYPVPAGPVTAFWTAGSTVRLIRALVSEQPTLLHTPAPGGLPGGYPVRVGAGRLEPADVPGLTRQEAVAINVASHPYDGIQTIEADGTAVFEPESAEILRLEMSYDCRRLAPDEAPQRGAELAARFRQYAARHGVHLDRLA